MVSCVIEQAPVGARVDIGDARNSLETWKLWPPLLFHGFRPLPTSLPGVTREY
jgi:hypothetical protein